MTAKDLIEIMANEPELVKIFASVLNKGPYQLPSDFETRYNAALTDLADIGQTIKELFPSEKIKQDKARTAIRNLIDEGGAIPMAIYNNWAILENKNVDSKAERQMLYDKWASMVSDFNKLLNDPKTFTENNTNSSYYERDRSGQLTLQTVNNYKEWKYHASLEEDRNFNHLKEAQKKCLYAALVFNNNGESDTPLLDVIKDYPATSKTSCNVSSLIPAALMLEARNSNNKKLNLFKSDDFEFYNNITEHSPLKTHVHMSVKGVHLESTSGLAALKANYPNTEIKTKIEGGIFNDLEYYEQKEAASHKDSDILYKAYSATTTFWPTNYAITNSVINTNNIFSDYTNKLLDLNEKLTKASTPEDKTSIEKELAEDFQITKNIGFELYRTYKYLGRDKMVSILSEDATKVFEKNTKQFEFWEEYEKMYKAGLSETIDNRRDKAKGLEKL